VGYERTIERLDRAAEVLDVGGAQRA
jgi:hypothetical protein